jgi:hypothetical protein
MAWSSADDTRVTEMAEEFPEASFLGLDLAPGWSDRSKIPDNVVFELCNVVEGISCPDETFDIINARSMLGEVSRHVPSMK